MTSSVPNVLTTDMGERGALLIDHKSGGAGDGLGAYWGQLSTYAALAQDMRSDWKINGVGIFWLDHGRLEMSTSFDRGRIVESFDIQDSWRC